MKKRILILFTALLLTSCAQQTNQEVSDQSEISETSIVSEVSKETSKEVSKKVLEISQESKKESSEEISDSSSETAEYPRQIVENIVDVNELGEKTKGYLEKFLKKDSIYMDVTGELSVFGGIAVKFHAELASSDSGVMEKFTFGENSVKILSNSDGTYMIDDTAKKAVLTGEAYNPDEKLQTDDGLTKNSIADQILLQLSSSFSLDTLEYKGRGSENYKGKEYDFEEYSADGKTLKVYFDSEKPVYITSMNGDNISEIEIHAITETPDSSMFRIPDGYEIVE